VIAEDQQMMLGALGSLLNLEEDLEVVGKSSNGEQAIELVHQLQPDICITRIHSDIFSRAIEQFNTRNAVV
jgi:two-component system response regulator DesR